MDQLKQLHDLGHLQLVFVELELHFVNGNQVLEFFRLCLRQIEHRLHLEGRQPIVHQNLVHQSHLL